MVVINQQSNNDRAKRSSENPALNPALNVTKISVTKISVIKTMGLLPISSDTNEVADMD
jgi:hypothetical protein